MNIKSALSGGGFILAFLAGGVMLVVGLFAGGAVDPGSLSDDTVIVVSPKTGVDSFDVAEFCADPLTKVRQFPAPDTTGITYQLTRVSDSVTETVTYVWSPTDPTRLATHYFDANVVRPDGTTAVEQQSAGAVVSDEARDCIRRKSG